MVLLIFEAVKGSSIPVAADLYGTMERVVCSMGLVSQEGVENLEKNLGLLELPLHLGGFRENKAFASMA